MRRPLPIASAWAQAAILTYLFGFAVLGILASLRLPGDAVFILGGAVPLCWLCWRAVVYPNPRRLPADGEVPAELLTVGAEAADSRA